jgi:hypothetical protein
MDNLEIELIDLIDVIDFTISKEFITKWKMKYGERIIRLFQIKIIDSMKNQKPLKLKNLVKFLVIDSGFNYEVVESFLLDIDFDVYSPIITGSLQSAKEIKNVSRGI